MQRAVQSIQRDLAFAAGAYLRVGLDASRSRGKEQAAIGNLAIAVELLIKARLAGCSLDLLFEDVPWDGRVVLADSREASDRPMADMWLRRLTSFSFKTRDIGRCIEAWNVFYPDSKELPRAYLKRVAELRDRGVHRAILSVEHYELMRVVYTAATVYRQLSESEMPGLAKDIVTSEDLKVLEAFSQERAERFHQKMVSAIKKAQSLTGDMMDEYSGWEEYTVVCPVCGNLGFCTGETVGMWPASWSDYDDAHGDAEMHLHFIIGTFKCGACGLELGEPYEFDLAGLDGAENRDEDLDEWRREQVGGRLADPDQSD